MVDIKMSKLMENKEALHVASEVVVMLGLTFYFNQQNKKLKGYIEDIVQRIEEQEDIIQKHEELIRKLSQHNVEVYKNYQQMQVPIVSSQQYTNTTPSEDSSPKSRSRVNTSKGGKNSNTAVNSKKHRQYPTVHINSPLEDPTIQKRNIQPMHANVTFNNQGKNHLTVSDKSFKKPEVNTSHVDLSTEEEFSENDESDLDKELAEELEELDEYSDTEIKESLKKRI